MSLNTLLLQMILRVSLCCVVLRCVVALLWLVDVADVDVDVEVEAVALLLKIWMKVLC